MSSSLLMLCACAMPCTLCTALSRLGAQHSPCCDHVQLMHNTTASKRRRSFLVQCCSANHGANHGGHDSHTNTALHLKMVCKPRLLMHTTTWWNSVADQNSNITEITLAYTILLFIRYCRWSEHRHRYPEQLDVSCMPFLWVSKLVAATT